MDKTSCLCTTVIKSHCSVVDFGESKQELELVKVIPLIKPYPEMPHLKNYFNNYDFQYLTFQVQMGTYF